MNMCKVLKVLFLILFPLVISIPTLLILKKFGDSKVIKWVQNKVSNFIQNIRSMYNKVFRKDK